MSLMGLWNRFVKLFAPTIPKVESSESAHSNNSDPEPTTHKEDPSVSSVPPAVLPGSSHDDAPPSPTTRPPSKSAPPTITPAAKKPKSKSMGRHSSGISEKTIKQLKEKYRTTDVAGERKEAVNSKDTSEVDGSSSSRRSKKKHKMASSRSHSRKSESLRKAVLMQEEVKHVMTLDDVREQDEEGNTPLHRVALLGNYEAVSSLCKKAPDIVNRLNTLHYASNSNCVNVLIWWGAGIDIKSATGKTPLYCAVERASSPDTVEALLHRGAKVNQKTHAEGWASLHIAALRGLVQIVEVLVKWNANVNAKDARLSTPLHFCAGVKSRESEDICRKLMTKNVKACTRDYNGATPLHLACGAGNMGVLLLVIEEMNKTMPDALFLVDNKGFTAYHYAAMGGHLINVCRLLNFYKDCIEVLRRELPICEQWTDDLGLSYPAWGLTRGYFISEFYPSGKLPYCADFTSAVNEEGTCDVVFIVEGVPVFAHKIFCYTSPYLVRLIEAISMPGDTPLKEATFSVPRVHSHGHGGLKVVGIELKGIVAHKQFLEIIQFMYTGKISKDSDWNQLWHAAAKLELLRLQQMCEKELGIITRDSAFSTLKRNSNPFISSHSGDSSSITSTTTSSPTITASPETVSPLAHTTTPVIEISSTSTISDGTTPETTITETITDTTTTTTTESTAPESAPPSPSAIPQRRRASTRKRNSESRSSRTGIDPQIDFYQELSTSLRKFAGNQLFHDMLFVCGEEHVYAHRVVVQKRCPNFFFVLAKHILSPSHGRSTSETVFHFDDITKGAMMGLMEYIYSGCFHSKMEAEDVWVMYNFVLKHSISCPGLKERASFNFYHALSPDNVLDIYALNLYGFTINVLQYTPDSARESKDTARDSPRESPRASPRDFAGTGDIPHSNRSSISINPASYLPSSLPSGDISYPANIALPNSIHRHSISVNDNSHTPTNTNLKLPTTNNPHSPSHEIAVIIVKYASKDDVMKFATKHHKQNPTSKLLQKEVKKHKTEVPKTEEADISKLWKDRRKDVKAFALAKRKRAQEIAQDGSQKRSESSSSVKRS